jgi:UDP-N-acetylglucosamine diphosphorylase/glucosamine-1-phosphate N-acetyltransferase
VQVLLFDDERVPGLHPLTLTRPAGDLRVGILTVREKWEQRLRVPVGHWAGAQYLRVKFNGLTNDADVLLINGRFLPSHEWLDRLIPALGPGEAWHEANGNVLAARLDRTQLSFLQGYIDVVAFDAQVRLRLWRWTEPPRELERPTDLFRYTGPEIRRDFALLTRGKASSLLDDPHTRIYRPEWVFAEPGVKVRAAVLNAEDGPIYLGHHADIQEGALIHGAHAILEHAVVNMGAKLRGDSSIGPYCKVGGEISNSVLWGYSNKAHDGFLGNSVLGQWCNLGADTNTSNLKNTYGTVALYDYLTQAPADTGLTFAGLIMGDHSKAGINTMFNTGTVVGVASNVFGGGFPPKWVPSFRWGSESGFGSAPQWAEHDLTKALETAERVMARRGHHLDPTEHAILHAVYALSQQGY